MAELNLKHLEELLKDLLAKQAEEKRKQRDLEKAEREQRRKEQEAQKEQARERRAAAQQAARAAREQERLKHEAERAAARAERRRRTHEEKLAYIEQRAAAREAARQQRAAAKEAAREAARQQRAAAKEAAREEKRKAKELRQQRIAAKKAETAEKAAAREAKKREREQARREQKRDLVKADIARCNAGLMNTAMLYGAIYVLRSQLKLTQFESMQNLARALREAGFSPAERTQNTCWWEAAPILQKFCTSRYRKNAAIIFTAEDYITPDELKTGEWQPMNICRIKTGLQTYIISGYASKGTIPFKINPDDNTKLFHLPSLYERSCWLESTALKRRHGMETLKQLMSCRKTKYFGDRIWVYAPELNILPVADQDL